MLVEMEITCSFSAFLRISLRKDKIDKILAGLTKTKRSRTQINKVINESEDYRNPETI